MWFGKNSRLRKAIKRGSLSDVASLIEGGAKLNPACYWANRPLAVAARAGHLEVLKLLIAKGAKVNPGQPIETPLARAETQEITCALLEAGVDEYSQHYVLVSTAIRTMGWGHDKLNSLLDAGVNVDARNMEGETPVIDLAHTACQRFPAGSPEAKLMGNPSPEIDEFIESQFRWKIKFLLERGAEVDAQSRNGHTALIWSAFWNTLRITETLLEAGADPNLRNNDGMTALELAQRKGHKHVVKRLLAAGASPVPRANKPDGGDGL